MILENVPIVDNHGTKVTRICDHCSKQETVAVSQIKSGRKKHPDKDYCKKCSYLFRKKYPSMQGSKSWRGGRYLTDHGYFRVYMGSGKYQYEHKMLYSKWLGRELSEREKVHHIDLDKTNNDISNLHLCSDKSVHSLLHTQMEQLGFQLLNSCVWFDRKRNQYMLHQTICPFVDADIDDLLSEVTYQERRKNNSKPYLRFTARRMKKRLLHVCIAERLIGRRLHRGEVVHHIDGNTLNNDIYNLVVIPKREHTLAHASLQNCVAELYNLGVVKFSKRTGKYYVKASSN